jgi:predicted phosphodiesterase
VKHERMGGMLGLAACLVTASLAACTLNESGNLSASTVGDVSRPAERGSPLAALHEACGATGELTVEKGVTREPFLQQVTTSSAIVGWRAYEHAGQKVEVTTPDGTPVATVDATVEPTKRFDGAEQLWAKVAGLEPDTIYCYTLTANGTPMTEPIGFRTAPAADSGRPVRFLVFGDSGAASDDQNALLEQMDEVPYDLMLHVGDLAYNDGNYNQIRDTVFEIYEKLFRHLPFYPIAGNHDYYTDDGEPLRASFNLPNNEKWYSFDYGHLHVVALDAQQDFQEQAAWLEEDLASTDQPWKVVMVHNPLYTSGEHGNDTELRDAIEPILVEYGVQLVLTGHDHHYERVYPQKGIVHFVTGGGGRGTRALGEASNFTALMDEVIHYLYVEVGADEMVVHAIDGTGKEFDSVVIPRER